MSDAPTQTTPVTVVTGCLGCPYVSLYSTGDGFCAHTALLGYPMSMLRAGSPGTFLDDCPLPKLGDTVEVRAK